MQAQSMPQRSVDAARVLKAGQPRARERAAAAAPGLRLQGQSPSLRRDKSETRELQTKAKRATERRRMTRACGKRRVAGSIRAAALTRPFDVGPSLEHECHGRLLYQGDRRPLHLHLRPSPCKSTARPRARPRLTSRASTTLSSTISPLLHHSSTLSHSLQRLQSLGRVLPLLLRQVLT